MQPEKIQPIEAIFFDMNGTLRTRRPDAAFQRAATLRFLGMIGKSDATTAYWDELAARKKRYDQWAQGNLTQLSEEEIWTCWLLPEVSPRLVLEHAKELTLAWAERKGRPVQLQGADEVLAELNQRGYRLGVISNSMSSLDIPACLEAFEWQDHFETVILSAAVRVRKPSPQPFLEAARRLNIDPVRCAYVGNRASKDIPGCRRAGFGMAIFLNFGGVTTAEQVIVQEKYLVIDSLDKLLELFPARGRIKFAAGGTR